MVVALREVGAERVLAGVAAWPVPAVVTEGDGLGQGDVEPERRGDATGDLRHLERVCQPGALVVVREDEDLGLAGQPAERRGVEDAVPIPLEARPPLVRAPPPVCDGRRRAPGSRPGPGRRPRPPPWRPAGYPTRPRPARASPGGRGRSRPPRGRPSSPSRPALDPSSPLSGYAGGVPGRPRPAPGISAPMAPRTARSARTSGRDLPPARSGAPPSRQRDDPAPDPSPPNRRRFGGGGRPLVRRGCGYSLPVLRGRPVASIDRGHLRRRVRAQRPRGRRRRGLRQLPAGGATSSTGGPDGGDGGKGGDVWLVADRNVASLLAFRDHPHRRATSGAHGKGKNRHGRAGGGPGGPRAGGHRRVRPRRRDRARRPQPPRRPLPGRGRRAGRPGQRQVPVATSAGPRASPSRARRARSAGCAWSSS